LHPGRYKGANNPDGENLLRRAEHVSVKLAPKIAARQHRDDRGAHLGPKELFSPRAIGVGKREARARPENSCKNMERYAYDKHELHDGLSDTIINYT
jgi:hypothetical protein